jgi:very-short-patch-repair endonuclease
MGIERRILGEGRQLFAFRADLEVAGLAAEQYGVVSSAELAALGMTPSSIKRRRQRGHLHQIYPGVWAVGHAEPCWEGRLLAAVKACGPGALLSHYSANELFGFVDRLGGIPDVTVGAGSHRARRGIRIHRADHIDRLDRREHLGVPVTSPSLALLELASVVDAHRTRRAIRSALGKGKVTVRQLGLALERYPGRRGAATLRDSVRLGAAPTKSDAESDVLDIVLSAQIERPDVNTTLLVAGRRVVPDMRWPGPRLILEIDSTAWHSDPLARADDRERQALLEAHGEKVLRVHWLDAVMAPSKLAELLITEGAPRTKGE